MDPIIEESWKILLWDEFQSGYFRELKQFLVEERQKFTVYPPGPLIFNAFTHTPFETVKVVILGQDPYHGKGQAHGLCFSVPEKMAQPPSLVNIFKEIHEDIGTPIPGSGNLERWADQGVLLLNATLTVRANQAGSHQNRGWEQFTGHIIRLISERKNHVVFLLWGRYAQAKEYLIDTSRHLILKAAHPSPFSAHNGFFGCRHFSKTNQYLKKYGIEPIQW
ncbi:MAG: uracil-DNA glycosylase [Bacteroidales bacterium]|nr:uracil-DNA glycosylase [Bacteroidales bacterium]MBN2698556.1 uracil-DNA glycosylase [Bacteroidales bacterium]